MLLCFGPAVFTEEPKTTVGVDGGVSSLPVVISIYCGGYILLAYCRQSGREAKWS